MDYGKMAYLLTDELSQRIEKIDAKSARVTASAATFKLDKELDEKEAFDITQISGNGAATIIIAVKLDVYYAGNLILLVDGMEAAEAEFKTAGVQSDIMIASIRLDNAQMLSLKSTNGLCAYIYKVQISLSGASAYVASPAADVAIDFNDSVFALLFSENGSLKLKKGSIADVNLSDAEFFGYGFKCDAALYGEDIYIVYVDAFDNLWGVRLNMSGIVTARQHLKTGAAILSPAITVIGEEVCVAYVENSKAYYHLAKTDFSAFSKGGQIDLSVNCDTVGFVKNSLLPVIILSGGGKSFMKTAVKENAGGRESLSASIVCGFSKV